MGKGQRVRLKEVEGYASTHYHIPGNTVQRAATPELTGVNTCTIAFVCTHVLCSYGLPWKYNLFLRLLYRTCSVYMYVASFPGHAVTCGLGMRLVCM